MTSRLKAIPFTVDRIKLLPSEYLEAMKKDEAYLLILEPDRFLHSFRTNAGLPPKAPIYGGWESRQLAGHSLGHYMSAISRMRWVADNPEFEKRAAYIVSELKICQDKTGTGYTAALPDAEKMWKQVRAGHIDNAGKALNGYWAPWYTIHKELAGLIDCHQLLGTPHALDVAKGLADWSIWETEPLTNDQWQAMLVCEYGGMNEALANLYSITGEKKYLDLSKKFYDNAILDPLSEGIDDLAGNHANTQIPKIIGCAALYDLEATEKYHKIAETFWDKVVHHHTYAIGGNSAGEYFGPPDKLNDTLATNDCETCNTYNMVKLSNKLMGWHPTSAIGDYIERALTNHILASQNHKTGMMCYYVTLESNTSKIFNTPFDSFWCCTGTGMENHSRYGESIFFHKDSHLTVSQFIPCELDWKEQNAKVRIDSSLPDSGDIKVTFTKAPASKATLRIRKPYWAAGTVVLKKNGVPFEPKLTDQGFYEIADHFSDGDEISMSVPMDMHLWPMPDNDKRVAIFYGPTILAGAFGTKGLSTGVDVPPLIPGSLKPGQWLEPSHRGDLTYITNHVGRPQDYQLKPFNQINDQRTTVYWDLLTNEEWDDRMKKAEAEKAAEAALDARTIDHFIPGSPQSETSHHVTSKNSNTGWFHDRTYRDGEQYSFVMKVVPNQPEVLTLTFWGSDVGDRVFDVSVDGQVMRTITLNNNRQGQFYREMIPLAASAKDMITVELKAKPGAIAGGLFGSRTIKKQDAAPTALDIDPSKKKDPISPLIYGQFLEHLGHCINQGIWSEILLDRKFYYPIGSNDSPWKSVGAPEFAMDVIAPFVGEHTPMIDVESGKPGGIFQDGVWLKANQDYVGYVWLKGDKFSGPITVSLSWGKDPKDNASMTISNLTDQYKKYEFRFKSGGETENGSFQIQAAHNGRFWVGTASLMPGDNVKGMRPDIIECLKELDGTLYRWPGGNFVSGYNWQDGIGDRDRRPPRKNPAWSGIEPNDFGAHEYMELCRLVGFEPLVVVNTGLGTIEMATEELEYFNGPATSKMGRLRAKNGHSEPFKVQWWGIGNEMYGDWQLGHIPLEDYWPKHNAFVDAMRRIDPKIKTIGVGDCYSDWSKGMLEHCWDRLTLLSEHFYVQDSNDIYQYVSLCADQVRNKVNIHRDLRKNDPIIAKHPVPITFDEWNYWHGKSIYGELGIRYYWKDGMGIANGLHEMFKNSDIVHGANYAQTVNVIGAIKSTPFTAWLETTGLVLELYRRHFGTVPVELSEAPVHVNWTAALLDDGKTVAVACVNPTPEPVLANPSIAGGKPSSKAIGWQIKATDPMAYNDEKDTHRVKIEEMSSIDLSKPVEFPPLSVTILHLQP